MFQNIKVFNSERLTGRSKYIKIDQNTSFKISFNKLIVSVLCFHNCYKFRTPHKTKKKCFSFLTHDGF